MQVGASPIGAREPHRRVKRLIARGDVKELEK